MTGKTVSEFITELYNNPEMEFLFRDKRYMLSGYIDSKDESYTLELWLIEENKMLFSVSDRSREKCVEAFEKARFFDNKNIYEAEDKITVIYG